MGGKTVTKTIAVNSFAAQTCIRAEFNTGHERRTVFFRTLCEFPFPRSAGRESL
jgi:hypothetical protein